MNPPAVPVGFAGANDAALAEQRRKGNASQGTSSLIADADAWVLSQGIVDPEFPVEPCPFAVMAAVRLRSLLGRGAVTRQLVLENAVVARARADAPPLNLDEKEPA